MTEGMQDEALTFPAFAGIRPGKGARGPARGRSWWAKAWMKAVEDDALDLAQLKKGKGYARTGRVGAITIAPGLIQAPVYDELETYRPRVVVRPLTEAQWVDFLSEVARQAGHLAALMDRDMPRELIDSAERAGVPLLPAMGDLEPECSCPDWEFPCLHAAALCYQTAWLLDSDPFLLLLLRGRSEGDLLEQLSERQARQAEGRESSAPRLDHDQQAVADGSLPPPLPVPERPGPAPDLDGGQADPAPAALERAVSDAAVVAWRLLHRG